MKTGILPTLHKFLSNVLFYTGMLCLVPFVIGFIDAWTWLVLGSKLSHIEWDFGRVWLAWAFLIPAIGLAGVSIMMELENGK